MAMKGWIQLGVIVGLALRALPAGAPADLVGPRKPGPLFSPSNAWLLEERSRDRWQRPEALIAALGLRPGDAVADIGAGSGYMMAHLARAVGAEGRVYSQDIQSGMVRLLRARAARHPNVRVLRGRVADPGLPPDAIDAALLLTSYHEMEAPITLLSRLRRAMRPRGRLVIVDFNEFEPDGVAPWVSFADRVPEPVVIREAARAGWQLVRRVRSLPYQYCLVFRETDGDDRPAPEGGNDGARRE
jgi:ubiquinone/menaquinone biosynthesis C-methylase UbiE